MAGNSETKNDVVTPDEALANLPFGSKDADGRYTKGAQLEHVQYGRVTSKLHAINPETMLKDGKKVVNVGTRVASFANYGTKSKLRDRKSVV